MGRLSGVGWRLLVIALVAAAVFAVFYGATYFGAWTYAGRGYDVTVKVANVERSEHLFIHTNVWVDQFIASGDSGREALKYRLEGHQFLDPGKTYRIQFTNRVRWHWWKGFYIIGVGVEIAEAI